MQPGRACDLASDFRRWYDGRMKGENRSRGESPEVRAGRMKNRLRDAGLRATLPRMEVLRRLEDASAPSSHGDLADELVPMGFDRATVYRNLNDLVESGLATRVDLGDHVWRFEVRAPGENEPEDHPHFLCNDCGEVVCLPEIEIPLPRKAARPIADIQDVVLRGRCASC